MKSYANIPTSFHLVFENCDIEIKFELGYFKFLEIEVKLKKNLFT